mgnify:CR=1 FL=1
MDIQTESPNATSSAPVVDAVAQPTTLTQDMEADGQHPATLPEVKPLTGMEAIGTPQMPEILATAQTKATQVADAKNETQTPKPNLFKKAFGLMGFGGGSTPAPAVASTPDHLTQTPNGTLETPAVPLVTADAAAAVNQTTTNYAGLSTPDATAVGTASPENTGVTTPAPVEVVASDAPSLGTSQPEVAPQPTEAVTTEPATATTLTQDMENAGEHPAVLESETPETPPVFTPSADVTPAEEESTLPEAPAAAANSETPVAAMPVEGLEDPIRTSEPAEETPVVETPTEVSPAEETPAEELPVGQSADANAEAVHAGPGAVTNGAPAPTDWSVNADLHPDAPVVPGQDEALGQAMADGAAAAAERPPFSTAALAEPTVPAAEVGHDIPIETGSETKNVGEIADDSATVASDVDNEPTAPTIATPGGMTPTDPTLPTPIREGVDVAAMATGAGMVNDTASLDAGLPQTQRPEVVPNSTEVNNVVSFSGGNQATAEAAPVAAPIATAAEASSNVTAFPATPLAEEKPAA